MRVPRRISKIAERCARHATGIRAAWRYSGAIAREHNVSRFGMLAEALAFAARGRMAVDTYFYYRLFDPGLTPSQKRHYLSEAPRANERLWSALTPREYGCLYNNKLIFNRFFTAAGLPLATIFGVFDAQLGRTQHGEPLRTETDLAALLCRHAENGFVFKPAEGVRGHLTFVFRKGVPDRPGVFETLDGQHYDAAALVAASRRTRGLETQAPESDVSSFIVEERIRPHPDLAEFIGPTLCTARVLTVIARDGSPSVVAAVFKVQPRAIGVDHLLYGAVASWIDLDTGALGPGRTRTHCDYVTMIPGTARPLVGYRLPLWAQVKEVALAASAAFPPARAIGWDIAISDRGAVLIEGNERWSPSLLQLPAPRGLMDGELAALYTERLHRT